MRWCRGILTKPPLFVTPFLSLQEEAPGSAPALPGLPSSPLVFGARPGPLLWTTASSRAHHPPAEVWESQASGQSLVPGRKD